MGGDPLAREAGGLAHQGDHGLGERMQFAYFVERLVAPPQCRVEGLLRFRPADGFEAGRIAERAIPAATETGQGMDERDCLPRRRLETRPGAAAENRDDRPA